MTNSEIRKLCEEVEERQKRAHETVCALCKGEKRWTMSVPAEPERDPDLVIDASLSDITKLVAALREKIEAERAIPVTEKLPEKADNVLVFVDYRRVGGGCGWMSGYYFQENWCGASLKCVPRDYITHWRELPSAPEVKA